MSLSIILSVNLHTTSMIPNTGSQLMTCPLAFLLVSCHRTPCRASPPAPHRTSSGRASFPSQPSPSEPLGNLVPSTLEDRLHRTSRCFAPALFLAATDRRALLLSFLHSWAVVRGGVVAVSSKISAEPVRLHRARVKRYLAPWRSRGAWAASRRKRGGYYVAAEIPCAPLARTRCPCACSLGAATL